MGGAAAEHDALIAHRLAGHPQGAVHTGGRDGGAITAAQLLQRFVEKTPWAHLDIAGTAWLEESKPYLQKGPSGVAVRTLAELAFTSREWI